MRLDTLNALYAAAGLATVAVIAENVDNAKLPQLILGLPLVFFLPGFAAVRALLPSKELSGGECVLASLGSSLAIATCQAILLGATIGLSQRSIADSLGLLTMAGCGYAWVRSGGSPSHIDRSS